VGRIVIVNFTKYHPADRELTPEARKGEGPLKWVRLQCDWYEDGEVMRLPSEQRYIWPFLIARAGKGQPRGTITDTLEDLAHLARTNEDAMRNALDYLAKTKRIKGWRSATGSVTNA
jgi:hypothetical protein